MPDYENLFLKALVLTISIETIILFVLVKTFFRKSNLSNILIIFSGILASFSTLPYLWFVLPHFIHNKISFIIAGEIMVVIIESLIYFFLLRLKYSYSLLISFICNLFSFLLGLFIL